MFRRRRPRLGWMPGRPVAEGDARRDHLAERRVDEAIVRPAAIMPGTVCVEGRPPSIVIGGPKPARRKTARRWSYEAGERCRGHSV
jgi:hypothetical protein